MNKQKSQERKKLIRRLKNKYRLVLMNDATFEERFSASLTPLNVIAGVALVSAIIASIVVSVIVFTPIKEYIPGYSDTQTRINALNASLRVDSLERAQVVYKQYMDNLKNVLAGNIGSVDSAETGQTLARSTYDNLDFARSKDDEKLRNEIESEERFALTTGAGLSSEAIGLPGVFFFTPIRGTITSSFDLSTGHTGVDLVAPDGEAVKAVYDGTVIFASFTSDGGNVIYIQHPNNLISVYKHNAVLLKTTGNQVQAGQTIAIVGNTGEFTDGPHLHFELWYDGLPLNPQEFIAFPN
jgi:murein DD-endopeptidase MepM/ murein hydrolase activator NlpD